MSLFLIIGAAVIVPIAVVLGVGKALPVAHVARVRSTIHKPVHDVWQLLTDFASYPSWRPGVAKSEQVGELWKEVSPKGEAMTFETVERVAQKRLVRRIADKNLPFGGQWIFELEPRGESETIVTITEEGEVYNPVFRFVSRFIMGHHATLKVLLEDLGKHFGQEMEIEKR
ncbi:MAG TPA: SRPBCC family protein [Thermoanaerobaculia bacterium]|jgi:uncharacterized protein YndB with AHSA1/START domain|nr:SRPBCC family protein [Thermoanaerobaculia bacterium]